MSTVIKGIPEAGDRGQENNTVDNTVYIFSLGHIATTNNFNIMLAILKLVNQHKQPDVPDLTIQQLGAMGKEKTIDDAIKAFNVDMAVDVFKKIILEKFSFRDENDNFKKAWNSGTAIDERGKAILRRMAQYKKAGKKIAYISDTNPLHFEHLSPTLIECGIDPAEVVTTCGEHCTKDQALEKLVAGYKKLDSTLKFKLIMDPKPELRPSPVEPESVRNNVEKRDIEVMKMADNIEVEIYRLAVPQAASAATGGKPQQPLPVLQVASLEAILGPLPELKVIAETEVAQAAALSAIHAAASSEKIGDTSLVQTVETASAPAAKSGILHQFPETTAGKSQTELAPSSTVSLESSASPVSTSSASISASSPLSQTSSASSSGASDRAGGTNTKPKPAAKRGLAMIKKP